MKNNFLDLLSELIFRRIRISQRLLIAFVILSIVPLSIIGFVSTRSSTRAMEENISSYSIQLLTQVANNLENEIKRLEELSMAIMDSNEMDYFDTEIRGSDEKGKLEALKQLESLFQDKLYSNADIASIGFYPLNYDMVAKTEVLINSANASESGIFDRIMDTNGRPLWIYMKNKESDLGVDTDVEYSGNVKLRVQTPVHFRKMSSMSDARPLGVLHIAPKKEVLQSMISNIDIGKDGRILLMDGENKVLASVEEALTGNPVYPEIDGKLKALTQKRGYFFVNLSGANMLVCYSILEGTGWKVLSMIPFNNLTMRINQISVFVLVLMVFCIFVSLVVSYLVTRSVSLPINRINETVECLGKGDFSRKLDIRYNDELTSFSAGFNKMIDDMKNLITEVYVTKIQKLDSEFKALQAQINPHFLYNTLESINSLALIKKEWEISEMIRGLASVFRYSIKNNDASVTLKDEIEHARLYILLQALRYEDRIEIGYDIPDSLKQVKVLKFMLQPLVENAIIHGIGKTNRKGSIRVAAKAEGAELHVSVSDNGKGMEEAKLQEIRAKLQGNGPAAAEAEQEINSIGLMNIHSRIRLHFGEAYGLSLESGPDQGTVIKIKLPLR